MPQSVKALKGFAIYRGKLDESIRSFLPEQGKWHYILDKNQSVICKNHPDQRIADMFLHRGEPIIAVKWEAKPQDNRPHWRMYFYCGQECFITHKFIKEQLQLNPSLVS